jgi:alkanesulfonate monooxygenase SsuD/methylene tetrahydromethanopterin reductase-like flavin-dependent oxidoreductase (luciferase family)
MNLGLAIADFTWPDRRGPLAHTLRQIAVTAEDVGFTRLAVMDHLWQIGPADAAERLTPLGLMGDLVIPIAAQF